jgi:mRNA interferase RelE/StbE
VSNSNYRVRLVANRVKQELARVPRPDRDRIAEALRSLADAPRPYGIKQLGSNVYRLRVGNYRVIYQILDDERLVIIGRIARRSERTYRRWRQLFEEPAEYKLQPQPTIPLAHPTD